MKIVAPSILSADFGNLERDVRMLDASRAEWIHFDVMDGVFVPNISFGFPVLEAVRRASDKFLDAHLMICDPIRYIERFAQAGADCITFHYEAAGDVRACIEAIRTAGVKAGISIKPATPPQAIAQFLPDVDLVLVMSVEPGFGGQSFIPASLDKVAELKRMREQCGGNYVIQIDGGISAKNAGEIFAAGADVLVAGSSVFNAADPQAEIAKMLEAE